MQTNSAILMQARSYNLQWKSSPPTKLKLLGVKRKRIVCVCVWLKRIAWVWTTVDPKGQRNYEQTDMVAPGRRDQAAWVVRKTVEMWPFGESEKLAPSTWRRVLPCACTSSHPWPHRRWRTNSIYSSSHKIRFLSICPEEATLVPYLFHLIVFN